MKKSIVITAALIAMLSCSCGKNKTDLTQSSTAQTETQDSQNAKHDSNEKDMDVAKATEDNSGASKSKITADMAYEGVNNYCHSSYDWSVAKENPSIMYVKMGEETESEYQVIFRSYTGAFVYFYVDKTTVTTRIVESVPNLDVEEEVGTIDLFDYIEKK